MLIPEIYGNLQATFIDFLQQTWRRLTQARFFSEIRLKPVQTPSRGPGILHANDDEHNSNVYYIMQLEGVGGLGEEDKE